MMSIKTEASKLFEAMSPADRWAYYSDECSLFDIFERAMAFEVRVEVAELVNAWVQSNPEFWYEGGVGS